MNEWFQAEFHAERAHQFYEAGQWEKALAELRLALAFDPDQGDWHFGMGLALEALHRYDEAAECFEQVLRLRSEDVEAMLHLGTDLIRSGRHQRAIEVLAGASKTDPQCEPAYCHRIFAHARLGEHEQAEEMFYLARQVVEECPQCFDHMARSLEARGDLDKAVWCWQQSLRLDPHYPDAYGCLARVSWRRGQAERAHQYFLRQLREDPGDIDTLLALGRLLVEMGRHAEAGEKFRRVLEMDPSDAAAHQHLGELALMAGHLDAAAAELEQAGRLDPQRPGVHLAMAQVALRRNRPQEARFHAQAEQDHSPHSLAQSLELAQLLIELGQPQPAINLLTPRLEDGALGGLDPRHAANLWLYRGVARLLTGQTQAGIRDCRRAYHLSPRNVLAAQNLALAYLTHGGLAQARIWLGRAVELRPDDPQVRVLAHRVMRARLIMGLRDTGRWVSRRVLRCVK